MKSGILKKTLSRQIVLILKFKENVGSTTGYSNSVCGIMLITIARNTKEK